MMSLGAIRQLSRETAERAAAEKTKPYTPFNQEEIDGYPPFPFPNVGDYRHPDFELVRVFFVDKMGLGRRGEPAYTIEEFTDRLVPGRSYAIVEEGEFQVHIGEFVGPYKEAPEDPDLSGRATYGPESFSHNGRK